MTLSRGGQETRRAILEAAGEIIAYKGIEATSIRAIVRKANAALSSVNYYFGSKEQLYIEAIDYILQEKIKVNSIFDRMLDELRYDEHVISNTLYKTVRRFMHAFLSPDKPQWYAMLILRARLELQFGKYKHRIEVLEPSRMKDIIFRYLPDIPERTVNLCLNSIYGQMQYYVLQRETVLRTFNKAVYDNEIIEDASYFVGKTLSAYLDLPRPERVVPE